MLEGLYVDRQGLQRVQELCKARKTRVIFLPMFKSFADPLVMNYINYFFNMELGFSFGNYEDSPKIHFVEALFKRIGHFLIKRREFSNLSVNYVNQALMQEVIESNLVTTIYQNDERPRSGKFNLPLYPDNMIKLLLKSYLGLKKYQYDIKLVPVCIEYDRIFDSRYLSTEIQSGLFAPGTKLINVMQRIFSNRKQKLGKCIVRHSEPIDLDTYINDYFALKGTAHCENPLEQKNYHEFEALSMQLTKDLYIIQQKEQPIMMNAVLSSCFMFSQREQMTFGDAK